MCGDSKKMDLSLCKQRFTHMSENKHTNFSALSKTCAMSHNTFFLTVINVSVKFKNSCLERFDKMAVQ